MYKDGIHEIQLSCNGVTIFDSQNNADGASKRGNIAIGDGALSGNTGGSYFNLAIGINAGNTITSGANNTMLGIGTDGLTAGSNQIAIGRDATCNASNQCRIGNSALSEIVPGGGSIDYSTIKAKERKLNKMTKSSQPSCTYRSCKLGIKFVLYLIPNTKLCNKNNHNFSHVIPAQAGIHLLSFKHGFPPTRE